jgi:hypothetical protein
VSLAAVAVALAVAAQSGASAPDKPLVAPDAKSEEEEAFAAVDRQEWCPAMHHFLAAHALAPSADLTMNAAMAAEYGGDLAAALDLYTKVAAQKGARRAEAKKKATELGARTKKEGGGTPCPAPAAQAEAKPPEPAPLPAPAPAPTPPPAADEGAPVWPLVIAGVGALGLAGGAALTVVGVLPWFAHQSAAEQLRAAEKDKSDDKSALLALQKQQSDARDAWDGYGKLATIGGAALATLGVVAVGAGIGLWFALGSEPE